MKRLYAISAGVLLAGVSAYAGSITPIQIGGATGLTSSYITSGCAGGAGNCVAGSKGSFSEGNYDTRLFQSTAGGFTPYVGYNQTAAAAGTLGQFAMIDDTTGGGGSNNFWFAGGTTAIDVPIGLNNLNDVSLMLNDIFGVAGASDTVVTFDFANTSNGSTVDQVVVNLTNSGAGGSAASGQIQSGVDCSSACTSGSIVGSYASGTTLGISTPAATLNGSATTVSVTSQNLFTASYTSSNITGTSVFAGSSGNINLDALDFNLSAYSGMYLTQILVANTGFAAKTSQIGLSAITADQITSTPEPSTIVLLIAGLGALGVARIRRT
jgi:hypothetical protein